MPPKRMNQRPVEELKLEEALEERQRLVHDMMETQDALGNKNRCHPDGRRFTAQEYWEWHGRATHFLRKTQIRVSMLKERIRVLRNEALAGQADVVDTSDLGLLKAAYHLIVDLVKDGVDLEPEEQAKLDLIRNRFQTKS